MNGFVLLSASMFVYFTGQILDDGLCDSTNIDVERDPNKELSYANFIEHFYHVLDVLNIERVAVETGSECLLRCVSSDRCFSTNVGAFQLPNGKIWCDLLPTDKYNTSEKFKTNHTFHHYSIWVSITYDLCYRRKSLPFFMLCSEILVHVRINFQGYLQLRKFS